MPVPRFHYDHTALLVVDVQEKLLSHIHNAEQVERQVGKLIDGFTAIERPILVTEQYRKGLGRTVPGLLNRLTTAVCNEEKLKFSACTAPIREQLTQLEIRSVVVCGIEAHVCVLQSCLDLIDVGLTTAVVTDAVGSRREADQTVAVSRMTQAGVVPTTVESVLFEMVYEAGTPRFKAVLPVIK